MPSLHPCEAILVAVRQPRQRLHGAPHVQQARAGGRPRCFFEPAGLSLRPLAAQGLAFRVLFHHLQADR